jgi:cytochrome oxidase Cu insertion factor (SCO1/SenC/PrrC family)
MSHEPEPICLTVHSLATPPRSDVAAPVQRSNGRLKMLVLLAICALPVLASYFTYYVIRPQARGNYGSLILPTRTMPALALADLEGRPVMAASLRQQWLLVVATPSRCEAACERLLYLQRQLREMLGRERDRVDRLWLVLDDGPLSPAQLQAVRATAGAIVLRARRDEVQAWLAAESGRSIEEHLYIVDPMGEWMMRMPVDPDPAQLRRDLERLLRASASWDRAGR